MPKKPFWTSNRMFTKHRVTLWNVYVVSIFEYIYFTEKISGSMQTT